MNWKLFFNSNFFIAIVTLIVGGLAIYLYWKQKVDCSRDAAKLILQEIRYVERKIRKYREMKVYKLYEKLLPTNNWNNNINLFIKKLKETDIDLISDFYAKASYIDIIIETISRQKNNLSKFMLPQNSSNFSEQGSVTPAMLPKSPTGNILQSEHKIDIIKALMMPPVSQSILDDVSMSVEFIYNTPVVEKLRKISEKKWYQLF